MKDKTMKVVCISRSQHPDMEAAAVRQFNIASGLVKLGVRVDFYVLRNTHWGGIRKKIKGIDYISFNKKKRLKGVSKIFDYLISVIKTGKSLIKSIKSEGVDVIILYPGEILLGTLILGIAKKNNIKVFHERTELPYTVLGNSLISKISYKIYLRKLLPRFKGVFVISSKLQEFIEKYNENTKKILTVVDPDFFKTDKSSRYSFPYIAYCGKMSGTKDGVPILIEAFAEVSRHNQELKLVLIGDDSDKEAIKETLYAIEQFKISDKIIFTGMIDRDEMPVLLGNAKVLTVAKPDNEQNSGNFPIKIGEYLATGVPIVVTDVGEISSFVKHNSTGFLSKPDSAKDFAKTIKDVLDNYDSALKVGKEGQVLAEEVFDYRTQAKEILEFIDTVDYE